MMRAMRAVAGCLLYCATIPSAASAGLTVFYDLAEFQTATAQASTIEIETFDSTPQQVVPREGGRVVTSRFDIVVDENHGALGDGPLDLLGIVPVERLLLDSPGNTNLFLGDVHAPGRNVPQWNRFEFDAPITAFGLDISTQVRNQQPGGIVDLHVGELAFPSTPAGDPNNPFPPRRLASVAVVPHSTFVGVVADPGQTFEQIEFRLPDDAISQYYLLDNIRFAPAVPEPASWAIVGLLLVGASGWLLRPRANS